MTYVGIYASSVSNHSDIICVPSNHFLFHRITMPIQIVTFHLGLLCIFLFGLEKVTYKCCSKEYLTIISLASIGFLLLPISVLLFYEEGVIIKGYNNSDVMFQYFNNFGDDPRVYPIFLQLDGINNTYPNSTCDFVPFSELCLGFGPLPNSNLSGAFKCQPKNVDGLEPFLLYLKPLLKFAHTAMNLYIAFIFFFAVGYFSLVGRRLLTPDEWIENRCCWLSHRELDERKLLI